MGTLYVLQGPMLPNRDTLIIQNRVVNIPRPGGVSIADTMGMGSRDMTNTPATASPCSAIGFGSVSS